MCIRDRYSQVGSGIEINSLIISFLPCKQTKKNQNTFYHYQNELKNVLHKFLHISEESNQLLSTPLDRYNFSYICHLGLFTVVCMYLFIQDFFQFCWRITTVSYTHLYQVIKSQIIFQHIINKLFTDFQVWLQCK